MGGGEIRDIQARVETTFLCATWVRERRLGDRVVLLLEVENDLVTGFSEL